MYAKEIGSFEAKTHLSSLIKEVEEKGTVFRITRRGKPVAVLQRDTGPERVDAMDALKRLRSVNIGSSIEELIELKEEGRER